MIIPGPWFRDQYKARTAVAKLLLEQRARVGGDQIAGGGRIAVVQHSYRPALEQRVIEVIQGLMGIQQVLRGPHLQALRANLFRFYFLRFGNRQIPYQRDVARIQRDVILERRDHARQ